MAPPKDPTASFFDQLASMGHVPMLHRTSGTVRFDLDDGGQTVHWFVTIRNGDVSISHRNTKADSVARTQKSLFDRMANGKVNAMAALLRDVFKIDGDPALVLALSRLLPGPPHGAPHSSTGKRSSRR